MAALHSGRFESRSWPAWRYGQAVCLLRHMERSGTEALGASPARAGQLADMLRSYASVSVRDAAYPWSGTRVRVQLRPREFDMVGALLEHASTGGLLPWMLPSRFSDEAMEPTEALCRKAMARFGHLAASAALCACLACAAVAACVAHKV